MKLCSFQCVFKCYGLGNKLLSHSLLEILVFIMLEPNIQLPSIIKLSSIYLIRMTGKNLDSIPTEISGHYVTQAIENSITENLH